MSLITLGAKTKLLVGLITASALRCSNYVRTILVRGGRELTEFPFPIVLAVSLAVLLSTNIAATTAPNSDITGLDSQPNQYDAATQHIAHSSSEQSRNSPEVAPPSLQIHSYSQTESLLDEVPIEDERSLVQINVPELLRVPTMSKKVIVAVLDTGVDQSHDDLIGLVVGETNFTNSPTTDDVYGHGTHVAGIIAAKDNDIGSTGIVPDSLLLNVKVADDVGHCQTSALAKGIVWAVQNGAKVINVSIELSESSTELQEAVDYAWNHDCVIVAAASNHDCESPVYPAFYDSCIAVCSITQDSSMALHSSCASWVDVSAPGCDIYSTIPQNSYGCKTGNSFATAYVSGVAALLFNITNDVNGDGRVNDEIKAVIESGCQCLGVGESAQS